MRNNNFTEGSLVEQPAIELFSRLGWETINCFDETLGPGGILGRETTSEVVLIKRLKLALRRLNPELPDTVIQLAIEELIKDRSAMNPTYANCEIYKMLRDGVTVLARRATDDREETYIKVKVIDWNESANNDFLLASQLWISGEMYKRRADLVGFVNGLPLVFIELKASHRRLEHAYRRNLRDYKETIPQVFLYNAIIILSNGSQSRVGTITSEWENFVEWKKINSEGEKGVVSLETMIRGTCEPERLFDIVENFILFSEAGGGLVKMMAKNHQYLGVNNVIEKFKRIEEEKGRLGVFWHTQGSGKSYSMIFFSQKILRTIPGNYTFVIVTDRQSLDRQIYKNFVNAGAITEQYVQADSGEHLKQLLREDHRYIFTLIQKFHTRQGAIYSKLSDRSDIIVITDEAHRTQYDIFALNMRNALPKAAFIGFTGTPLIAGEEKTKEVFGDYVSIYNFKQSADDRATVPLYYENRIPELQLTNRDLNAEMEQLLDEAALDEEQERRVEREFSREYQVITRDTRLERIAEDIVDHFMGRGFMGKAMVVSIDKATAVKMYDKVQKYWEQYKSDLEAKIRRSYGIEKEELEEKLKYMKETDLAVVVSQSQNEIEELRRKGVDITPHRRRMVREDLDTKFKKPEDPFRIVFVCAMWMTGFDVPCCSTMYLDKPMRNHTLMQTIARANRVFGEKNNGLIVDYIGVFRDLQKALAIYGTGAEGGETPVRPKGELVELLREAVKETKEFCIERGVDLLKLQAEFQAAEGFSRVRLLDDAVESIIVDEESKRKYLSLAAVVNRLYKAILPDPLANEFRSIRKLIVVLANKIRLLSPEPSPPEAIDEVMGRVEGLLDDSVRIADYVIKPPEGKDRLIDLSKIDFEALKEKFKIGHKRMEAEKFKSAIGRKLKLMVWLNRSRMDFMEKFQKMLDEYNAGAYNLEVFFKKLTEFAKELGEEEKRAIAGGLTEEELAVFDLLTKPEMDLTEKEKQRVKKVARELLQALRREKLVLDWRKRQQTRAVVRVAIEETLEGLPERYTPELFNSKCDVVYQHVYDSYFGRGQSIYEMAGKAVGVSDDYFPGIGSKIIEERLPKSELFVSDIVSDGEIEESEKFISVLPIYSLETAAGKFGDGLAVEPEGWMKVDIGRKLDKRMFVAKVVGYSMEPKIPNNSYCVFSADVVGSRQGKIVLAQHHDIGDIDTGGSYTVKKYYSEKRFKRDGTWQHEKIILEPLNKAYKPIILPRCEEGELKIIAEFITILE
ncbi:hypothetical protein ES705_01822 [subsurface metagenome]|nr:HsdR family type I site-specific deoxyribonuclease [Clostridia bacterium]